MGKWSKVLATSVLSLGILTITTIVSVPTIVSSEWGRQKIASLINKEIAGSVEFEKLNISWFNGQLIENLTLKDPDRVTVLTVKTLSTSQPLWELVFYGFRLAHAKILELNASVIESEDGISNLESALSSAIFPIPSPKDTTIPPLILQHVNGAINIPSNGMLVSGELSGITQQGDLKGHFEIEATHLKEKANSIEGVDDLTLSVRVENFPVNMIDHVVGIRTPKIRGLISAILGKSLNLRVDETQNGSTAYSYWDVRSDNVQISFNGFVDPKSFSLANPAKAEIIVTPNLVKHLTEGSISVMDSSKLTFWVQDFSMPWTPSSTKDEREDMVLDLEFDLSRTGFTSPIHSKDFFLEGITGEVISPKGSHDLQVHILGKAVDKDNIQFKFDAVTKKPFTFESFFDDLKKHIDFNLEASGFPTLLLNQLINHSLQLDELVGEEMGVLLNGEIRDKSGDIEFQVTSDKINMSKASFNIGESLSVTTPFTIDYILTPTLFNKLDSAIIPISMLDPTHMQLKVNTLQYPLANHDLNDSLNLDIKIVSTSDIHLRAPQQFGDFSIENARLAFSGSAYDDIQCEISGGIHSLSPSGIVKDALGGNTEFQVVANLLQGTKQEIKVGKIQASAIGAAIKIDIAGVIKDDGFDLSQPATINYMIDPKLIADLNLGHTPLGKLEKTTPILLTIAPMEHPFTVNSIESINLSGHISLPELPLSVNNHSMVFSEVVLPWEVSGVENRIRISFSGRALEVNTSDTGTFRGKYVVKDWISGNAFNWLGAEYKLKLDLIDFPSNAFAITSSGEDFVTLLGDKIQANIDIQSAGDQEFGEFDLNINGDRFNLRAAMVFRDSFNLENPKKPASLEMTLTPARFKILEKYFKPGSNNNLALQSDAEIIASLDYINIPWKNNDFHTSGVKGKLSSEKMNFVSQKNDRVLHFNKIEASVDTENVSKSVDITFKALPEAQENEGFLTVSGSINDLFTQSGILNLKSLSINLTAEAQKLNADVFSQIFAPFPTIPDKIEAILGDPIDLKARFILQNMNGPITAELKGARGKAFLDGQVVNGGLLLNKPFIAEVVATPQLGEHIFGEIAPFLSPLESASKPITLRIDSEGFFFPIKEFSKQGIAIGNCSIDTGRMIFRNEREIRAVLGILGTTGSEKIPVWLTPLYIHMKNGKAKLRRVDMLVNDLFPVAAWGNVDIVKKKVDMTIGITGYALMNAFNLGGLDPDYILQIPFKGSMKNPKLDKKKATARISAMIAESQGIEGMVLGKFLDIASGNITESKVPDSTTNPLPWHDQLPKKEKPTKVKSAIIEKPAEKLQEGAQKLYKKIFR